MSDDQNPIVPSVLEENLKFLKMTCRDCKSQNIPRIKIPRLSKEALILNNLLITPSDITQNILPAAPDKGTYSSSNINEAAGSNAETNEDSNRLENCTNPPKSTNIPTVHRYHYIYSVSYTHLTLPTIYSV